MINQNVRLKGAGTFILTDKSGEIQTFHKDNMILDVGFDFIANSMCDAGARPAVMDMIAIGTDASAGATTDVGLGTELLRKACTYTHTTGTRSFKLESTFAPGEGTGAIVESGVVSSEDIFLDRVAFDVINKGPDDTLTVIFSFSMS